MFFGAERAVFLDFLRNLSPQILLLAIMLVAGSNLDTTYFWWTKQGIKNVVPVLITFPLVLGSVMANTTLFIERTITTPKLARRVLRAGQKKVNGRPLESIKMFLWVAFTYNKSGLLRGAIAVAIAECGLTAMVVAAIPSAVSILATLQEK